MPDISIGTAPNFFIGTKSLTQNDVFQDVVRPKAGNNLKILKCEIEMK
jgi:hypothetical protein